MSYLGKAPGAPGGVRQVYEFVATAGQTTFSGADRNGATLSYDPGFANVFVGGVMLSQADVTATNGSSIVLLSGVPAGKIVQIEAFGTFKVADALTIAGGAVNGYLTTPTAPQFDNTKKLATTAFVQRALGNFNGLYVASTTQTLPVASAGSLIGVSTGGITLTMPARSSLVDGATFFIKSTIASAAVTISPPSGDGFVAANGSMLSSISLGPGDEVSITVFGSTWVASGPAVAKYQARFGSSFAASGYQKLPSGLIIQWGRAFANNAVATQKNAVTFPTAFPTNPVMVLTDHVGSVSNVNTFVVGETETTTGFSWGSDYVGGLSVFWMALGY